MKNSYIVITILIIIWVAIVANCIGETFPSNKTLAVMARTNGIVFSPSNFITANNLTTNGQTFAISNIVGLQGELASKLATNGTIQQYQVSGLTNSLASLQTNINSKSPTNHTHNYYELGGIASGRIPFGSVIGFLTNSELLTFSPSTLSFGNGTEGHKTLVISGGTDNIEQIQLRDDNVNRLIIKNDQEFAVSEFWSQNPLTITSQNDIVISPAGSLKIPYLTENKALIVKSGGEIDSSDYNLVYQDGSATNITIYSFANLLDAGSSTLPLFASANGIIFFKISNTTGDDAPCEVSFGLGNEVSGSGTAFGTFAIANNSGVAIGCNTTGATNSVGIGKDTQSKNESVGIGFQALSDKGSVSIGSSSRADTNSISIGLFADSYGTNSIAIGSPARARGLGRVQIGEGTNSTDNTLQFKSLRIADATSLNTSGGRVKNLITVTTNYTFTSSDHVIVFNPATSVTGYLGSASSQVGREYTILNKDSGGNVVYLNSPDGINYSAGDYQIDFTGSPKAITVIAAGDTWLVESISP